MIDPVESCMVTLERLDGATIKKGITHDVVNSFNSNTTLYILWPLSGLHLLKDGFIERSKLSGSKKVKKISEPMKSCVKRLKPSTKTASQAEPKSSKERVATHSNTAAEVDIFASIRQQLNSSSQPKKRKESRTSPNRGSKAKSGTKGKRA